MFITVWAGTDHGVATGNFSSFRQFTGRLRMMNGAVLLQLPVLRPGIGKVYSPIPSFPISAIRRVTIGTATSSTITEIHRPEPGMKRLYLRCTGMHSGLDSLKRQHEWNGQSTCRGPDGNAAIWRWTKWMRG